MSRSPINQHSYSYLYSQLSEVVDFTKTMGVIFLLAGVALICFPEVWASGLNRRMAIGGPAVLLVTPGLLYCLSGFFLTRMQLWAWRATTIMTSLLMVAVLILFGWNVYDAITTAHGSIGLIVTTLATATTGLACWFIALAVTLHQLRRSAPLVRQAHHLEREGFDVLVRAVPETPRQPLVPTQTGRDDESRPA